MQEEEVLLDEFVDAVSEYDERRASLEAEARGMAGLAPDAPISDEAVREAAYARRQRLGPWRAGVLRAMGRPAAAREAMSHMSPGPSVINEIKEMDKDERTDFEKYLDKIPCLTDQQIWKDIATLEVYEEPIVASDGNTYDLKTFNRLPIPKKSPMTRELLTNTITPNLAIKQFIICQLEKYRNERTRLDGGARRRRTRYKKTKRKSKRRVRKTRKYIN